MGIARIKTYLAWVSLPAVCSVRLMSQGHYDWADTCGQAASGDRRKPWPAVCQTPLSIRKSSLSNNCREGGLGELVGWVKYIPKTLFFLLTDLNCRAII